MLAVVHGYIGELVRPRRCKRVSQGRLILTEDVDREMAGLADCSVRPQFLIQADQDHGGCVAQRCHRADRCAVGDAVVRSRHDRDTTCEVSDNVAEFGFVQGLQDILFHRILQHSASGRLVRI